MSLVTLTFGSSYKNISSPFKEISEPFANLKPLGSNSFEVKKVTRFFGDRNVFVIGKVKTGVVSKKMKSSLGGKTAFLIELDSRFGGSRAKQGMTVGLTLAGIEKDDLKSGQIIDFYL